MTRRESEKCFGLLQRKLLSAPLVRDALECVAQCN